MLLNLLDRRDFQVLGRNGRCASAAGLGVDTGKGHHPLPAHLLIIHVHPKLAHQHLELLLAGEVILHCLLHQLFNLLHGIAFLRVESLINQLLGLLFRLVFFLLFTFADGETVLRGQLFHQLLALCLFLMVINLPAFLIHAHGYNMVVLPVDVVVPIDDEGLVSIAQTLHQLLGEFYHLLLCHPIRFGRIDGHMEGNLFTPAAAPFISFEGLQRIVRIIQPLRIDHGSLALLHLPLIILEAGGAVRRGCVDFHYHIRMRSGRWSRF